jgi:DeoR family transcriptional regulator, suf operon transcriptional repressor
MGTSIAAQLAEHPLPPAYKGPRGMVLVALKRHGSLTARQLSEYLGLSANAIRHHLKELEGGAVIDHRREQRGVGAPTHAWYLSSSGEALFPQRYKEILTEVLDRVVAHSGREAVVAALQARFADLARKLQPELRDASPERRMDVVIRALVAEGFMAEWQASADDEGGFRLTEHHCAIRAVAERFPEICAAEVRFLEEVLAAAVQRETHMLDGCTACEYHVRFAVPAEPTLTVLQGSAGPTHEERQ